MDEWEAKRIYPAHKVILPPKRVLRALLGCPDESFSRFDVKSSLHFRTMILYTFVLGGLKMLGNARLLEMNKPEEYGDHGLDFK